MWILSLILSDVCEIVFGGGIELFFLLLFVVVLFVVVVVFCCCFFIFCVCNLWLLKIKVCALISLGHRLYRKSCRYFLKLTDKKKKNWKISNIFPASSHFLLCPLYFKRQNANVKWCKITQPLRKHAYSNVQKILPPKNENCQIFSYICLKHRLWVIVRTASTRRF